MMDAVEAVPQSFTNGTRIFSGPITALNFVSKDYVIAGEGSFLKIYSMKTGTCILIEKVFQQNRIHKFKVISKFLGSVLFMALGGKTIRLFRIHTNEKYFRVDFESDEVTFGTWIWDVAQVNFEKDKKAEHIALVTSQNCVLLWSFSKFEEVLTSSCTEQCILYSASLWGSTFDEFTVAVGTVFNEILIWKPFHFTKGSNATKSAINVEKRLTGHEGVIFSVVFTTDATRLLSVSDDRTIRHWDIKNESCLQALYGHKARVWDAAFLGKFIVSIGEDATCVVWDNSSTIIKKFKGHQGKSIWSLATQENPLTIATGGGDSSIRVWSLAMLLSSKGLVTHEICLPNGQQADDFPRNLCILSFRELLVLTNNGYLLSYNFNGTHPHHGKWKVLFQDDKFSRYSCMKVDLKQRIAVIGNLSGIIKIVSIDYMRLEEVKAFDGKVFSAFITEAEVVGKCPTRFVVACGPNGIVVLWKLVVNEKSIDLKQYGYFALPYCKQRWPVACKLIQLSDGTSNGGMTYSLILGDRRGSIHVFSVDGKISAQPVAPFQSLLSMHGKTGVTKIVLHNKWVYSTGRDGIYRKFSLSANGSLTVLEKQRACKGMDWIAGIIFNSNDLLVYGFYMQSYFAMWSPIRNEIIQKIHCGGGYRSWDFAIRSPKISGEDLVFGYLNGKRIILCDVITRENQKVLKEGFHGRELTCICILGQHNTGDLVMATGSEDTLVNIVVYKVETQEFQIIHRIDSHIGSVKSIGFIEKAIPIPWHNSYDSTRQERSDQTEQFCAGNLITIRNDKSYLLFTCGSRTSLKCFSIMFNDSGSSISSSLWAEIGRQNSNDATRPDDVRFVSMQIIAPRGSNELSNSNQFYCVVTACSDGFIRFYGFSCESKEFCFVMATDYHKRCVQIVRHFVCRINSRDHHLVLSCSTDGYIALWDISECIEQFLASKGTESENRWEESCVEESRRIAGGKSLINKGDAYNGDDDGDDYGGQRDGPSPTKFFSSGLLNASHPICHLSHKPIHVFEAHQSGIHSLSLIEDKKDSTFEIASGGDDNAVFTSKFLICENQNSLSCDVIWTDRNKFAHHSTITGVHYVNPYLLITCSIDQRLKLWRKTDTKHKLNETRWINTSTTYTDVADASNMACFQLKDKMMTAICGVGIEMQFHEKQTLSKSCDVLKL